MTLSSGMTAHPSVGSGPVAQWSEQATHNRSVGGSIPPGPTLRGPRGPPGQLSDNSLKPHRTPPIHTVPLVVPGGGCKGPRLRPRGPFHIQAPATSASRDGEGRHHPLLEVAALVADHVAEQRVAAAGERERGRAG